MEWLGYGLSLTSEHFILGFGRPFVLGLCLASRERDARTTAAKLIFVVSTLYLAGGVLGQKHRNGRWGWISPGVAAEQTDVLLREP